MTTGIKLDAESQTGPHVHTPSNDDLYDPDIEYQFLYFAEDGFKIDSETYRTLEELFSFEHDKWEYDTYFLNEIKQDVREKLNCDFIWEAGTEKFKIQVRQLDTRKEGQLLMGPLPCTCRPGFRGDDAFCRYHKD